MGEGDPLQTRERQRPGGWAQVRAGRTWTRVHSDSHCAIRGSASPASGGQSRDLARPPRELVVLVIGCDVLLDALGEPRLPDEHDEPVRQAQQHLAAHALGRDRPLLAQLAHERVGGALAEVDRAAGAERPAPGPRGDPRGAPSGEPAPVGGAGDAQRGHALRGVAVDQPERPAQRLHLDREAQLVLAVVDEARGDAVVAWRAAFLQLPDRRVGGLAVLGRGLERLLVPARGDLLQRPRSAGEDLGCVGGGLRAVGHSGGSIDSAA